VTMNILILIIIITRLNLEDNDPLYMYAGASFELWSKYYKVPFEFPLRLNNSRDFFKQIIKSTYDFKER
jgi:hypothetical protein